MDYETILKPIVAAQEKEIEALYLKHGFTREFVLKHEDDFRVEVIESSNTINSMNLRISYHYYRDKLLFTHTEGYVIEGLSVKFVFKTTDFHCE